SKEIHLVPADHAMTLSLSLLMGVWGDLSTNPFTFDQGEEMEVRLKSACIGSSGWLYLTVLIWPHIRQSDAYFGQWVINTALVCQWLTMAQLVCFRWKLDGYYRAKNAAQ